MKDISNMLRKQTDDCSVLNALLLLLDVTIERSEDVHILQSESRTEISGRLRNKGSKQGNESNLG